MVYFVAGQTSQSCKRFGFQLTLVYYLINLGSSFLHNVNVVRKIGKIVKFLTLVGKSENFVSIKFILFISKFT